MDRYLSVEKIASNISLKHHVENLLLWYFYIPIAAVGNFYCSWPYGVAINEEKVTNEFPSSLLVSHTQSAYTFLKEKLEVQK